MVSPVAALSALLTGRVSIPCARTVGIAVPSTAKAVSKVFIGRINAVFDVSVEKSRYYEFVRGRPDSKVGVLQLSRKAVDVQNKIDSP